LSCRVLHRPLSYTQRSAVIGFTLTARRRGPAAASRATVENSNAARRSGAVVGLFLLLTVKRNTIFVRGASVGDPPAAPVTAPVEMRATGTFRLDKATRRFLDMPAAV
jgi:hypothetical protein